LSLINEALRVHAIPPLGYKKPRVKINSKATPKSP